MKESRTANSFNNVLSGLVYKVVFLLTSFISRTIFIKYLGESCLGLNGLFTTILSLLSITELGIGEAITYYLYKPISEENSEKLSQLIRFYKICYRIIGIVFLGIGLLLIPALPYLVNLETDTGYNLYIIYILYLVNSAVSYLFFSYPQTILSANQKNYLVTIIYCVFQLILLICDILVITITKNYFGYLIGRVFITIAQNLVVFIVAKAKYPYITQKPAGRLSKDEIKQMFKDVYGVFVLKISGKLIDSTDNIFISVFLGTILVGYNSNYLTFTAAAASIIVSIIFAFTGSVGNFAATNSKENTKILFYKIDSINFVIALLCSVFLFSFCSPFISIIWGSEMVLDDIAIALLCFNFYIVNSLNVVFLFRNCLGLFRSFMYMQLIAAGVNIILDFLLVKALNVTGLYLATIFSNITIAVFPYIISLFKKGFESSSTKYVITVIMRYIWVLFTGAGCYFACIFLDVNVIGFVVRVLITCGVATLSLAIYYLLDKTFRISIKLTLKTYVLRKRNV